MKKIFTLIATALFTMGASAQGTYAVMDGDAEATAGSTVTSVPNITMTWGVTGGANFKGGNKKSEVLKDILGSTAYCEGNGENGALTSGTVYYFEPTQAGTVTVGFVLNANKAFFVQDADGADVAFTCTNAEGAPVTFTDGKLAEKLTGGLATFSVAVGKKYAVYCTGSKLGFYGFKFELGGGDEPGGDTGSKFTYELATADGIVADFATTTELKGRVFAKVNKDPIVIKAVAGKLPANADDGAQQMTPDLDNPISGKEYTYAVKSVEAWTDASFNANNKFTDWNAIDPKYNMYFLQGTGNPYTALYAEEIVKDEGATHTGTYRANYDYYEVDGGKLPATGCYYKLTPKANGTLKLGIFAGKGNRKTYFIEETSKVPVTYTVEGYIANQKYPEGYEDPAKVGKMKYLTDEEIKAIATEAGSAEYVIGHYNAHFYGYLNATVEKGKSYYLFLHNGQMGLSSVEFNYDEASLDKTIDEKDEITDTPDPTIITGISTLKSETSNTNAQMYNLSGQKVDKSYKGIVIQNGRKFVNK